MMVRDVRMVFVSQIGAWETAVAKAIQPNVGYKTFLVVGLEAGNRTIAEDYRYLCSKHSNEAKNDCRACVHETSRSPCGLAHDPGKD
jgi:hypothetical protein